MENDLGLDLNNYVMMWYATRTTSCRVAAMPCSIACHNFPRLTNRLIASSFCSDSSQLKRVPQPFCTNKSTKAFWVLTLRSFEFLDSTQKDAGRVGLRNFQIHVCKREFETFYRPEVLQSLSLSDLCNAAKVKIGPRKSPRRLICQQYPVNHDRPRGLLVIPLIVRTVSVAWNDVFPWHEWDPQTDTCSDNRVVIVCSVISCLAAKLFIDDLPQTAGWPFCKLWHPDMNGFPWQIWMGGV